MKKIVLFVFLLFSVLLNAQIVPGGPGTVPVLGTVTTTSPLDVYPVALQQQIQGGFMTVNTIGARDSITSLRRQEGQIVYVIELNEYYQLLGGIENSNWTIATISQNEFDGNTPVLREGLPYTGEVIGGETVTEFLNNFFFPALSPLASLSIVGESILEFGLSGLDLDRFLSWSVDRRTNPIVSITVAGVNITPTGEDQSGSQSVTLVANSTNTFSLLAVDDSGLQASKSVSFYFRHGYYWGAMSDVSSITDADIMALDGAEVGTGKVLDTNRQKTFNGINGAGGYLVFAFPQSWGTPSFKVNGLANSAFTMVRSDNFINQYGYSEPYQVWVSNAAQNAPIAEFEIL